MFIESFVNHMVVYTGTRRNVTLHACAYIKSIENLSLIGVSFPV
jgi:hypothetical protein